MAKNQARYLSSHCDVAVYSNVIEEHTSYVDDGIEVNRCWTEGLSYLYEIPRRLYPDRDELDVVHLHHEFNGMYGGMVTGLAFPLLVLVLRLLGFTVVTRLHGLIFDVDQISDQWVDSPLIRLPAWFIELGLLVFNQSIVKLSQRTLVWEDYFKEQMTSNCFASAGDVSVIPHGIANPDRSGGQTTASENRLLFFGYLSIRKGPDLLLDAAPELDDWTIDIAGGKLPHLEGDESYEEYHHSLVRRTEQLDNVSLTGFVSEANIESYFRRADVVVIPYRLFIAASGVHSLAMKYGKPTVVSEQFARIFESRDVKPIFERSSLSPSEFVFSTEDIEAELPERLEHLTETDGKLREARAISEAFRETRSWENVAERYVELYHDVTSR